MKRVPLRVSVMTAMTVACAVYLPKIAWPASHFYVDLLSPKRLQIAGAIAKLVCLVLATVYGFRSAAALGKRNPARLPWQLLGAWLALWTFGQGYLALFEVLLGQSLPVPSWSDAAFVLGYFPLFAGEIRFVQVYRASGFPVGSGRQHAAIAAVGTVVVVAASCVLLAPIARSNDPPGVRFVNVVYPATDLLALVPTLVMIRIALAFRPGRVWAVWTALLTGFVFTAAADLLSAYIWPSEAMLFDPGLHLLWLLGYLFLAAGMKAQHELLTAPAPRRAPA